MAIRMNFFRRKLVFGTPLLAWAPAALWLASRSDLSEAATTPTSTSSLQVLAVGKGAPDPVFADAAGGRYITPPAQRIQGVIDGSVLRLNLSDVALGGAVHRSVWLTLSGPGRPAKGMVYRVGTSMPSVVEGQLVVNRLSSNEHHDFMLAPALSGRIGTVTIVNMRMVTDTATGTQTGQLVLSFQGLGFDPTPLAQVLGNKALRPVNLTGTVEVACIEESSAGWLA